MAAVLSNKVFTTSKNHQIFKSSGRISSYSPTRVFLHRQPISFGSTRLTSKKNKTHFISCSKVTSLKDGEFPSKNWWRQKFAEVAFEVAKAFILWVCGWLYKKHVFLTNLPFAKDDLVQMKVDGNLICGLVEDIGRTQTSIRGADDGFLNFVPNSEVEAKIVKILTLVTIVKADATKDPKEKFDDSSENRKGSGASKDQVDKADSSDDRTKGSGASKDQVDAELRLWGVTISMQLSFESYDSMNDKIKKIRDFIRSDSRVREHERIMVSFESYLPDKKAFKILVGFFVEAQKNIKEYSDIKVYFQMKLVDKVNTQ